MKVAKNGLMFIWTMPFYQSAQIRKHFMFYRLCPGRDKTFKSITWLFGVLVMGPTACNPDFGQCKVALEELETIH